MSLPRVRFTVRRLMAFVAIIGLLLWAWVYRRENASLDRASTTIHLRAFAEGDAVQRRMAIEDLAHFGPGDRGRVLPALAAGMADADWRVRLAAARSLGTGGRGWSGAAGEDVDLAMRALVGAFDDPRAEVQIEAMRSLGALYTDVKALSRNSGGRTAGATFEATERRAVALLLRRMSDSDPAIRTSSVLAFSRVGSATGAGPDPLVRTMISDPVEEVRIAAISALPLGWPTLRELYPPLLHQLKQAHSIKERSAIGWAINGLPAPPVESIPDLIEVLALDHSACDLTVPRALAKLGLAASPALPALARAAARGLADPKDLSGLAAVEAITTIDRDSAEAHALLPALAKAAARELADPKPSSDRAVQAIVTIDPGSPEAHALLPALAKAAARELADPMACMDLEAVHEIVRIDPASPEAQALIHPIEAVMRGTWIGQVRQQAAVVSSALAKASQPRRRSEPSGMPSAVAP